MVSVTEEAGQVEQPVPELGGTAGIRATGHRLALEADRLDLADRAVLGEAASLAFASWSFTLTDG
jgi:hypothetical protein